MLRLLQPAVIGLAATIGLLAASAGAGDDSWRKLPPLPGRSDVVTDIGLEGDTLWAIAGNTLAWWDGREWQLPAEFRLRFGKISPRFYGGGERPLLLAQRGEAENRGLIYRLTAGKIELQTEFEFTSHPSILPTSGGLIILEQGQLSTQVSGVWTKTKIPAEQLLYRKSADASSFYFPKAQKIVRVDAAGDIREQPVALAYDKMEFGYHGLPWGDDRVLVFQHFRPGLKGFRLSTGEALDLADLNGKIDELFVAGGFSTRDGSVWLLVTEGKYDQYKLIRVRATGECEKLSDLSRAFWYHNALSNASRILETKGGDVWLPGESVLLRLRGGQGTLIGQETGLALQNCTHLAEDSRGNLYSANTGGIYVLYVAEPPAALPAPRKPARSGPPRWTYRDEKLLPLAAAWKVGPTIYAMTRHGSILNMGKRQDGSWLVAVDAASGERRFQRELASDVAMTPWLLEHSTADVLEIAQAKRLGRFDAKSGETRTAVDLPRDIRIAPLPVKGGYAVVPIQRGSSVSLRDGEGQWQWRCELPGSVMMHPASFGKLAIFQTRGESYGGQETACVDLETGTLLWSDVTDAYGCGAAFFDDTAFVVEADQSLSPERSEGWLIGRDPQTGARLWHYRQAGGIHHPPLVDRRTARVYGVFSRGELVCLRGEDGSVVWQQTLPEAAFAEGTANAYNPAWSPHSLADGRLLAVDRNLVLHVLDAKTGEFQNSIALKFDNPQPAVPAPQLVGPPWIEGNAVIAAFSSGVVALPLPSAQP